MRAIRMALLVGVLASLALASACGNPKVVTPSTSPTVRTGYDRYLGWWSAASRGELLADLIRVYKRGTTYMLGGQLGAPLRLRDGGLHGTLSAGQGQVELRISANARHLILRWTHDGHLWEEASFTSATTNEIDDFLTQQIYSRVVGAANIWGYKHGHYPPASALLPDGAVGRQLRPWPTNPYTGRPIAPGSGPGDYQYRLTAHSYQLTYHEPDGGGAVMEPAGSLPSGSGGS
jgi:hypothetical protein